MSQIESCSNNTQCPVVILAPLRPILRSDLQDNVQYKLKAQHS